MTACSEQVTGGFTTEHLLNLFTKAPAAFWRFDVDVSLEAAAKMGRFAQLAGARGTFYIMARGEFYNPFSPAGARAVSAIHNTGHGLGLHVDYRAGDVNDTVARDTALLDRAYPGLFDLAAVSFHMPPPEVLWHDFYGFVNAYGSQWEGRYVSDSRREWNAAKDAQVNDDMQIALHSEHWFR